MADGRLLLEYAKSARAACPLCGSAIAKGLVRVGREKMVNKWPQVKWHHTKCFSEHNAAFDFSQMSGFTALKASDQEDLLGMKSEEQSEEPVGTAALPSLQGATAEKEAKDAEVPEVPEALRNFTSSQFSGSYKDIRLPDGWKAFSTLIVNEASDVKPSEKIAAFDFDGTLADTSPFRPGADAWSLLFASIPAKLAEYHAQGFKLVIFTNEANIERFTKQRAKAIDSKIGRLKAFMEAVKLPIQMFIACGSSKDSKDLFRKPATGMWHLLDHHLNGGLPADKNRSFYVGDAAGRKKDHSDADIAFAKVLGLKFLLPEEAFSSDSQSNPGQSQKQDVKLEKEKQNEVAAS